MARTLVGQHVDVVLADAAAEAAGVPAPVVVLAEAPPQLSVPTFGDWRLGPYPGAELFALMTGEVRGLGDAGREELGVRMRRAALREHSFGSRARQLRAAAGVEERLSGFRFPATVVRIGAEEPLGVALDRASAAARGGAADEDG